MTPIKVRGKKDPKIPFESRSASCSPNHLPPFEPFSHSRPSTGEPPRKRSRRHPARVLSSLERLPTELLENVFFQCLNVNLLRASRVLLSALSSFYVKSQLLFKLFSSDQGYGLQDSEELIGILQTKQEVANLQSSILRLRWMTTDFLRRCRPIFLGRTLLRQFKAFQWQWIDGSPAAKLTYARVAKFVQEAYRRAGEGAEEEQLRDITWEYSISDEKAIDITFGFVNGVVWLGETTLLDAFRCQRTEKRWKLLNCLDECRIPEKLLHGPWTDEKCEFLAVLIAGRATVDWIDSTSGEVAELGLYDALKEKNEYAVRLMIHDNFRKGFPGFPREIFVSNPDWMACSTDAIACRENARHSGHFFNVGVTPRMEHLRSAAIDYDCPIQILDVILKGENFSIERKDPALTSWALKKKVEGDKRGEWMLDRLDEVPIRWEYDPEELQR